MLVDLIPKRRHRFLATGKITFSELIWLRVCCPRVTRYSRTATQSKCGLNLKCIEMKILKAFLFLLISSQPLFGQVLSTPGALVSDNGTTDHVLVNGMTKLTNPNGRTLMLEREDDDSWLVFHDPNNYWYSMGIDRSNDGAFTLNFGGSLASSNAFIMKADGKIGVSTPTPASMIDIQAQVGIPALRMQGGFPYGTYYLDATSYSLSGHGVGYSVNVKNGGGIYNSVLNYFNNKIGIGYQNPQAYLDVGYYIDNGALGTVFGRLQEGNSVGGGTYLGVRGYATQQNEYGGKSFALEHSFYGLINSSINFYRGGGTGGGFLTFNTEENIERMRLSGDGSLAIGTTDSRGYKLAVAGKTITEEVVVKLQGSWPDYVFDKHYKLPSLPELEQFVLENEHLPEVPTSEEVDQDGLSLGSMNAILLKKVEELTLHLIDQNKRVQLLEAEVKMLKASPD